MIAEHLVIFVLNLGLIMMIFASSRVVAASRELRKVIGNQRDEINKLEQFKKDTLRLL